MQTVLTSDAAANKLVLLEDPGLYPAGQGKVRARTAIFFHSGQPHSSRMQLTSQPADARRDIHDRRTWLWSRRTTSLLETTRQEAPVHAKFFLNEHVRIVPDFCGDALPAAKDLWLSMLFRMREIRLEARSYALELSLQMREANPSSSRAFRREGPGE